VFCKHCIECAYLLMAAQVVLHSTTTTVRDNFASTSVCSCSQFPHLPCCILICFCRQHFIISSLSHRALLTVPKGSYDSLRNCALARTQLQGLSGTALLIAHSGTGIAPEGKALRAKMQKSSSLRPSQERVTRSVQGPLSPSTPTQCMPWVHL
jgi:hypothetical protein